MKKTLCILMALLMCVSLLPLSALAADEVVDVTQGQDSGCFSHIALLSNS